MAHSEDFIEKMKTKLLAEQTLLKGELNATAQFIDGEWQVQVPEYERDEETNAMEVDQATARAGVVAATTGRLQEVGAALQRIADGTYGVTEDGQEIPQARLEANPAATTVINE